MNLTPSRVGEVIEANSTIFVTQCYKLYVTPPLGGFVRTGSPPTYGVVSLASTEPLDRARPIIARGEQAASEADIYRDNPQLAQLLTSRFESLILGYTQDGASHQFLPPLPPRVHSFVYACTPSEVVEFTSRLDFIHLLLNAGTPVADEIVGACLKDAALAHPDRQQFLYHAGKVLAMELAEDLPRLTAVLRRIRL